MIVDKFKHPLGILECIKFKSLFFFLLKKAHIIPTG